MPQGIPIQFSAQPWWKSDYCDQFHTYSQWFTANFVFLKIFNSWKILKMLKIGCFKQNHCFSGMPQGIPKQFFAQQWWVRLLWPVSHIFTVVCSKICFFRFFNSWKMLKMLKIGCFKLFKAKSLFLRYASRYYHAICCSTMVKVRLLWPVSHIFTVVCSKICFLNFSVAGKFSKCLE